jgi:hypothetical protein
MSYYFKTKDAYYYIHDKLKSDVFICCNKHNKNVFIKWYPEYNEFKIMRGEIITNFIKKYNIININEPWIGILHYPEFVPELNYSSFEELKEIIQSQHFKNSVKCCKGIITLSDNLKYYVEKILNDSNYNIPVHTIFHPTDFECETFNLDKYISNQTKSIIQIGFWLRNMKTIFQLKTNIFEKKWFPGGSYWKEMFQIIDPNYKLYLNDSSVKIPNFLSNEIYDDYLSKNICLLDVFNSSANNTVLECIARNTPLLVNPNPAIVEYLGINYPLYFNNINELNILINSDSFDDLIVKTYEYLKNMDKSKFTIDYFIKEVDIFIKKIEYLS